MTHALKVLAPTNAAWSTHEALRTYLQKTQDDDRPIQLRGVLYAGISSKDVTKIELAALITLQNKRLSASAAVQVVNVWKIDTDFDLTDTLVHKLSSDNLDMTRYEIRSIREFVRSTNQSRVTLRQLLYAVLSARADISESPIVDDYTLRKTWNLVCDRDCISGVTTFLEWFIGVLGDVLSPQTLAQLCGCHRPHDPNQYPRIEYAKQYSPDQSNHLQTVYGCALQDFMQENGIPAESNP